MQLSAGDRTALAAFVRGGGVLVMMGDWRGRIESSRVRAPYHCDINGQTSAGRNDARADSASYLLRTVFGWATTQSTDSISPGVYGTPHAFVREAAAAGALPSRSPEAAHLKFHQGRSLELRKRSLEQLSHHQE